MGGRTGVLYREFYATEGGCGHRRLAVVTSDFHMPRSKSIFQVTAALAGEALWQNPERCAPAIGFRACKCCSRIRIGALHSLGLGA